MTSSPQRLDLEGQLAFEVAGVPMDLHASGARAEIRISGVADARRVWRALPARRTRRRSLNHLGAALHHADVQVGLLIGSEEVGRLAPDHRVGWFSRLLGLGPFEVRFRPLLRAWTE